VQFLASVSMTKFLLKYPHISERATHAASRGVYTFVVATHATKPEIRKALKEAYNVTAVDVRIINVKSKMRRLRQSIGTKPGYKKAIVQLKKGEKLDVLPHS